MRKILRTAKAAAIRLRKAHPEMTSREIAQRLNAEGFPEATPQFVSTWAGRSGHSFPSRRWTKARIEMVKTMHKDGHTAEEIQDAIMERFGYKPGITGIWRITGSYAKKKPEKPLPKGDYTLEVIGDTGRYATGQGYTIHRAPQIPWVEWRSYCVIPEHSGRFYIRATSEKDFACQFAQVLNVKTVKLTKKHRVTVLAMHPEWRAAA